MTSATRVASPPGRSPRPTPTGRDTNPSGPTGRDTNTSGPRNSRPSDGQPTDRFSPASRNYGFSGRAPSPSMAESSVPEERIEETETWPELAIGLYDRLTGRNAEIHYEFDDLHVAVPSKVGEDADAAHWRLDGTVVITTRERE